VVDEAFFSVHPARPSDPRLTSKVAAMSRFIVKTFRREFAGRPGFTRSRHVLIMIFVFRLRATRTTRKSAERGQIADKQNHYQN
jgi:hypothetical protein